MPSNTNAPLLVDRREAARLLGVSPNTISNLQKRGDLPSVKLLTRRLYDVADLRRYIESRRGVGR
ncbi:MAG: helix-turn-helix domain-containing protein [Phycisphaerales bacterium]